MYSKYLNIYFHIHVGVRRRKSSCLVCADAPKTRSDGGDVAVEAALSPAHVEGQRALQQAAEDLHLVCAGVLGDLEPLDQELDGRRQRSQQRGRGRGGGAEG